MAPPPTQIRARSVSSMFDIFPSSSNKKNDNWQIQRMLNIRQFFIKNKGVNPDVDNEVTSNSVSIKARSKSMRAMIPSYSFTSEPQKLEENEIPENNLLEDEVEEDDAHQRSIHQFHQEKQMCYFEHESGSLNLLDACRIKAQHEQEQANQDRRQLLRSSASSLQESQCGSISSLWTGSSYRSSYSRSSSAEMLDAEDVTINDTVQSIVSSSDSWEKVRNKIRDRNLVTSLGVIEVCLSSFQEEAVKLTKQRAAEAKKIEARLSKYSRFRRRLSLF